MNERFGIGSTILGDKSVQDGIEHFKSSAFVLNHHRLSEQRIFHFFLDFI